MKTYKIARSYGLLLLVGSIMILTPTRSHAESVLYAIDNQESFLSVVNPLTGAEESSIGISLANETIQRRTGLAVSPVTNKMYAAVKLASQAGPGRNLIIIDPETGVATNIGPMGQPIASLAFDGNGVLYAVSGDCLFGCGGAAIAETLFTVNTNNAVLTMVQTLGNGNDGEAIAFNPTDGMMYHMSGIGGEDLIFEKINLSNGVVTSIPLSGGDVTDLEAIGFTFDPGQNLFVGSLIDCGCDGTQRSFISITSGGFITHVNPLVIWWKDYAFYEVTGSDVFLDLEALADVNGNNKTDLGVLLRDSDTGKNKLYVMDGGSGNNIRTVSFGSGPVRGSTTVPDTTGDLIPEFAALREGSLFAQVKDVVNGTLLGKPKFNSNFDTVAFLSVGGDLLPDGNASQDVAVVGRDPVTGKVQAWVKDVASGGLVSKFGFSKDYVPFGAVAVDNVGDSAAMEIAVLGIDASGNVQAQVKDALSGKLISKIQFNKKFTPLFFAAVPNASGKLKHLAVLGRNASGTIQAQIKRVGNGTLVANVRFSKSYDPKAFIIFADSNGSGGGEIGVVGVNGSGKVRAQVKEIADGADVNKINFSRNYPPLDAIAVNGVAGTGRNEIVVLGQHVNGQYRLQIKDLLTGDNVNNIPLP